jgi:hypothetical protein
MALMLSGDGRLIKDLVKAEGVSAKVTPVSRAKLIKLLAENLDSSGAMERAAPEEKTDNSPNTAMGLPGPSNTAHLSPGQSLKKCL